MQNEQKVGSGLTRRVFLGRTVQAGVGLAALNLLEKRASAQDSVWSVLGDKMIGRPAVVKTANGLIEVYMRREDPRGSLWSNRQKAENGEGGWEGWEGYDDSFITRSPSAGVATNGDVLLLLVGKDGRGYVAVRRDNAWVTPFKKLGNFTTYTVEGEPAVAHLGNNETAVFLRTTNNQVWMNRLVKPETTTWSGWYSAPYYGASNIAAEGNDDGTSAIFARDKNNKLMGGTLAATGGWTWKPNLSAEFAGDPVIARHSDGILEVFVTDPNDKKVLRRRQTEKSKPFEGDGDWVTEEGLIIRGTIALGLQKDKKISLIVRADDGKIYQKPQKEADGDYGDWAILESGDVKFNEDPVVVANANGALEIFARGSNGNLYHTRQKEPNGEFAAPNVAKGL